MRRPAIRCSASRPRTNWRCPAGWALRGLLTGQYTRDALIPAEQFGAGGMGSVRGYEPREIANDRGISGSLEAFTPELCRDGISCRVVGFYDAAWLARNSPLPSEITDTTISSVGLGLRASVDRYATLQLDYGYALDDGFVTRRGDSRWHFKLSLSF
jgi:hemolysin activation/secretion protein